MHNSTRTQNDQEFLDLYFEKLTEYVEKGDDVIHLDPMNSFYRRLIHKLANDFGFKTHSEGEDKERHTVITRTNNTKKFKKVKVEAPKWDFGDQEFFVKPTPEGTDIYLGHDGNIGIYDENQRAPFLDKRLVMTTSFKVKNSKIVIAEDKNW